MENDPAGEWLWQCHLNHIRKAGRVAKSWGMEEHNCPNYFHDDEIKAWLEGFNECSV